MMEFTLSPSNTACAVLVLLLLTTIGSAVFSRYFDRLSHFPGPFWGSITRLWITYHMFKGDLHRVLREGHEKWGMISLPVLPLYTPPPKGQCPRHQQNGQVQYTGARLQCSSATIPSCCPSSTTAAPTKPTTTVPAALARRRASSTSSCTPSTLQRASSSPSR